MGRLPDEDLVIDKTMENPPHKNAAVFLLLMHNITFFDGNFSDIKENKTPMIVAPKEADELVVKLGKAVAYGINLAFHNIEVEDISGYTD